MPLNLSTPVSVSAQIDAIEIDSFAVDLVQQQIIVGYMKQANGQTMEHAVLTLSALDFTNAIARSNELANLMPAGSVNVYGAIKATLYEYLAAATGMSGTVA